MPASTCSPGSSSERSKRRSAARGVPQCSPRAPPGFLRRTPPTPLSVREIGRTLRSRGRRRSSRIGTSRGVFPACASRARWQWSSCTRLQRLLTLRRHKRTKFGSGHPFDCTTELVTVVLIRAARSAIDRADIPESPSIHSTRSPTRYAPCAVPSGVTGNCAPPLFAAMNAMVSSTRSRNMRLSWKEWGSEWSHVAVHHLGATRVNRDEGRACHTHTSQETGPIRLIAAGIPRFRGSNPAPRRDVKPLFCIELPCSLRPCCPGLKAPVDSSSPHRRRVVAQGSHDMSRVLSGNAAHVCPPFPTRGTRTGDSVRPCDASFASSPPC